MRSTTFGALGLFGLWIAGSAISRAAEQAAATPISPVKYTLRYRFQPGQVLRWDVLQQSITQASASTSVAKTVKSSEAVSRSTKVWRVKEVDKDGVVTFENLVEDIDMKQVLSSNGKANTMRYNSKTDKQVPAGFETVASSVGCVLSEVRMDPQGKVVDRKRVAGKGSSQNDGQITLSLPAEAIPLGYVWTHNFQMEVPLPNKTVKKVQLRQKFVLQNVQTGVATIAVSTQILTPIENPVLESQLIHTESEGHVKFDIDAGRVIEQQIDVDKRVVGFLGAGSSTHYLSRFTEKYLPM